MDYSLPFIFFAVAFLYSIVGFGGGSSYLAILSLYLFSFQELRSTALILNITVVSINTLFQAKNRVLDLKAFLPFLVLSIPAAFFGAQLRLTERWFFLILGSLLVLASIGMIVKFLNIQGKPKTFNANKKLGLGAVIGFFSGLSGIGGGIYLSPTLNLMGWQNAQKIASLASVFILVNSLSGLSGLWLTDQLVVNSNLLGWLLVAVASGAILGQMLSTKKFKLRQIGLLTAALVFYVGVRLVILEGS